MRELILASTSPYRRQMLLDAGIAVQCEASEVDESAIRCNEPVTLARELSRRKALAVAARFPGWWVLGADQVAIDPRRPDEPFGKPRDPDDHLARLRELVGAEHVLVTAFTLIGEGFEHTDHESTALKFRADIEESELRAYVATGEGSGCAGGYAVEGRGVFLVERIDGDLFNVIGLPLPRVIGAMRARGWRFA